MAQPVKPYERQEGGKKEQVAQMFDNIAPRYDLLNRLLSAGVDQRWRRRALNMLRPHVPKRVLDVATGTADLAIAAVEQLKVEEVVGVDISEQMLAVGRGKVKRRGMEQQVSLLLGDSENLPFEGNTFDAATVAFGVRNFENLDRGLAEIYRVLQPGGQVVVLEFSRPTVFPLKQAYNLYFRYVLPLIGRLMSKDTQAYDYLYRSVQAFPDGADFVRVLEKTGFKSTQWTSLTFGICAIYTAQKL